MSIQSEARLDLRKWSIEARQHMERGVIFRMCPEIMSNEDWFGHIAWIEKCAARERERVK